MARDDMTGAEFQGMVGYKPSSSGLYGKKVDAAQANHNEEWSDPKHAAKVLSGLHDAYHASGGQEGLNGSWHDRVARTAQNIASMHARATGQATATVLQNNGFHPVTGQSMRPAPESPTHTVDGGSLRVRPIG